MVWHFVAAESIMSLCDMGLVAWWCEDAGTERVRTWIRGIRSDD